MKFVRGDVSHFQRCAIYSRFIRKIFNLRRHPRREPHVNETRKMGERFEKWRICKKKRNVILKQDYSKYVIYFDFI